MASMSGSPRVAPIPCNTVRRGTCFLDMNMVSSPLNSLFAGTQYRWRYATQLKLFAVDHRLNDSRKLVILRPGVPHDLADRRHVVVRLGAAHRISQKVFHKRLYELF